ncbi:MAG TPA: hypothetical protein VF411_08500 [Bacteroidia bacterium]
MPCPLLCKINGTKGGLAGSYTSSIINDFNNEIRAELIQSAP